MGSLRMQHSLPSWTRRRLASAVLGAAAAPVLRAADEAPVVYPRQGPHDNQGSSYLHQLLVLALQKAGWPEPPRPSSAVMGQARAIEELSQARQLRVLWTVTSMAREQRLRPVRIPLDWGLIGWRVLLVRRAGAEAIAPVQSLAELARFRGVQGHDWPDLGVLRSNGLAVDGVTARDVGLSNLFEMLRLGRVDYFPRGVWEVAAELAQPGREALQVQPQLLLIYPSALYFFVHPQDERLALALQTGLELAHRDGSFAALFRQHHCQELKRLQIDHRRVLRLRNPDLSPETPLGRRELWLQPRDVAGWSC